MRKMICAVLMIVLLVSVGYASELESYTGGWKAVDCDDSDVPENVLQHFEVYIIGDVVSMTNEQNGTGRMTLQFQYDGNILSMNPQGDLFEIECLSDDTANMHYRSKSSDFNMKLERMQMEALSTEFDYNALLRYPEKHKGQVVDSITGIVFDTYESEEEGKHFVRAVLSTRDTYDNVCVEYYRNDDEPRILKNDKIAFRGLFRGFHFYTTLFGKQSIPLFIADKVSLVE